MNKDDHLIFEAYMSNAPKDADGVEIVNPNVRRFDNDFYLDEYLQRILYNYRKYQNPDGSLNKEKFVQAVDSIWTGTHPRALQNLHQELSKVRPDYKPETEFFPYLKNWLKKEALKKIWGRYIKIKNAAKNVKDEDAEMLYPTFAKLSKHASPKSSKEKEASKFKEQMPDSREEYSAQDYADEMEVKGEQEEDDSTALIVRGTVHSLGNGYSVLVTKEREEDRYSYDIDILKDIDPKNSKYEYVTQIHRLGEIGNSIKNWADSKEPLLRQKAIDALKKYGAKLPDINQEEEERRLDPKCWKGYHKAGTKLKGGVRVNKCVKNS